MNAALPASKINPLNQVLITHVLNEARHGNYHHCRALGFTDEMVLRLQNLTPCALTLLTHAQAVWIKPLVDQNLFDRLMTHIDKEEARERLVRRALSLGASNSMMLHFFGLAHHECAIYRRTTTSGLHQKGRPSELSEAQKHSVWKRWLVLVKQAKATDKAEKPPRTLPLSTRQSTAAREDGRHLDELTQLDMMMLIAEEQALPLANIWNEINAQLQAKPSYSSDRQAARGQQRKQSLDEKTGKALKRPHTSRAPAESEPAAALSLF